jgi:hypothetical protein
MRSVVLDLPEAVAQARRLAHEEGLDDVVTHRVGDALVDDLGDRQDVAFWATSCTTSRATRLRDCSGGFEVR